MFVWKGHGCFFALPFPHPHQPQQMVGILQLRSSPDARGRQRDGQQALRAGRMHLAVLPHCSHPNRATSRGHATDWQSPRSIYSLPDTKTKQPCHALGTGLVPLKGSTQAHCGVCWGPGLGAETGRTPAVQCFWPPGAINSSVPAAKNGLMKRSSPGECLLVLRSVCGARERRGPSAFPVYEHHIFYFQVSEERSIRCALLPRGAIGSQTRAGGPADLLPAPEQPNLQAQGNVWARHQCRERF